MPDWSSDGDPNADLDIVIEILERQAREPSRPIEPSEDLQRLAEAFAARHGFSPPPRRAPPELAPSLRFAIESGMMSEGQARDLDAFTDGLDARVTEGEISEAQAIALCQAAATRDGLAVKRARERERQAAGNRHERRVRAAKERKQR